MKRNIKKNAVLLAFTFLSVLVITGCKKDSEANFRTDKEEYNPGDIVELSNLSLYSNTYKWTMPDGETSTKENTTFALVDTIPYGTYTFKLDASSEKGGSSSITKTIKVVPPRGQIVFWQHDTTEFANAVISVDLQNIKTITKKHPNIPFCQEDGTATFDLTVGAYLYTATDGVSKTWSGSFFIYKNACLNIELR